MLLTTHAPRFLAPDRMANYNGIITCPCKLGRETHMCSHTCMRAQMASWSIHVRSTASMQGVLHAVRNNQQQQGGDMHYMQLKSHKTAVSSVPQGLVLSDQPKPWLDQKATLV